MLLKILSVLLMLIGVIWILQGVNILPGSFMSGQMQWTYRGVTAVVLGLIFLALSLRRR